MLVNEVTIKNYKSLRDIRFNAKRVNVFIGEPNSGKSNLVEALSFFSNNSVANIVHREMFRYDNIGNLFFDNEISTPIEIKAGDLKLTIEFAKNQHGGILNQFDFTFGKNSEGIDQENNYFTDSFNYKGEQITFKGITFPTKFRVYIFQKLKSFRAGLAPFLEPPFGENIPTLLLNFPEIKSLVSDFFRDKGYFLNIKPVDNAIELAKNINNVFVSYPYQTISETLQRIVFISLAIATNKDSVLIFDEPESNTFPFYTKYIAETIANDEGNQYFLTTHNPVLLMNLIEKTPSNELAVFIAKNKDYQTKLYPLSDSDMQEVVNLGHDVFFNLDKFTEKG
jgi:hypothetical protein